MCSVLMTLDNNRLKRWQTGIAKSQELGLRNFVFIIYLPKKQKHVVVLFHGKERIEIFCSNSLLVLFYAKKEQKHKYFLGIPRKQRSCFCFFDLLSDQIACGGRRSGGDGCVYILNSNRAFLVLPYIVNYQYFVSVVVFCD